MLSTLEKGVITLVRNALKGEKQTPPEGFDAKTAYEFARAHQIIPIVYYGGAHIEEFASSEAGVKMLMTTMSFATLSANQLIEIDRVCTAFEENKIEYLKLKGTILKPLYPNPEMRMMSDSDILIRQEQMAKIEPIMKSLGYKNVNNSDHEWIWQNDIITIELHKRLIATYQKDFYEFFGDGWQLALPVEGKSEYKMSAENELIYLFAHLSKHYRDAGIGVKHFTDIYVFLNAHSELNMEYVRDNLSKLGLLAFFDNVRAMLDVWFDNKECDEVSAFITSKIFGSGVYGQRLTELKSQALKRKKSGKKQTRIGRFFSHAFPPYKVMCNMFPVLNKVAILLPFMWIWRILKLIFCGKKSIEKYKQESKIEITEEQINEYQLELDYVGLDFNFEV